MNNTTKMRPGLICEIYRRDSRDFSNGGISSHYQAVTLMATYRLEIRSQKSRGSAEGRFGGPDTYVAVQEIPEGVEPLYYLNYYNARRRGIKIHYMGEGYSAHRGERSMLGRALAKARAFIKENGGRN